jgi:hypothetical protein
MNSFMFAVPVRGVVPYLLFCFTALKNLERMASIMMSHAAEIADAENILCVHQIHLFVLLERKTKVLEACFKETRASQMMFIDLGAC